MAQTAAEAVIDQRLRELETTVTNMVKRVEVMKAVLKLLARAVGQDWRKLVGKAAGELEAKKAREEQVA